MTRATFGNRLTIGLVIGAGGVVASGVLAAAALATHIARLVITPPTKRTEDIIILAATDTTVTLSATTDTRTRGRYSLWFAGDTGRLRIGNIVSGDETTVTRELLGVDCGTVVTPARARFSGWFYQHPSELGLETIDVEIETPVGPAPAWLIPAARDNGAESNDGTVPADDWVIQVHGRGVTRAECIRAVPVFHRAGFTSLLVSYRNDGVAPDSEDRRYALGSTEWRDVEAAIEFAIARGARKIVLMGWSMGGATVLQATMLTAHPDVLRGLVLESPVVDWRTVLHFQAGAMRVPHAIRLLALTMLGTQWGTRLTGLAAPIDLDSLNLVRRAHELWLPTLLLHSADDGYVPPTASRELAARRPDLVVYDEFTGARHAKLWNYDEERFDRVISEWLAKLS